MKKNKYVLEKKNDFKKVICLDLDDSFEMKKQNSNSVGMIKFYDTNLINKVIKKIIDNRFKKLLEFMANLDESDEDPSEGLLFCLDESSKFKRELINKYDRFLKKNQIEFINKKIELIEKETKNKLIAYRLMHSPIFVNPSYQQDNYYENDDEFEEERRRSR